MSTPNSNCNSSRLSDVLTSVITPEGELLEIYYHVHSGRIVSCPGIDKMDSHYPGIIIGKDKYGNFWVAQQHPGSTIPTMDLLDTPSSGSGLVFDNRPSEYPTADVARRATAAVIKAGKEQVAYENNDLFLSAVISKARQNMVEVLPGGLLLGAILFAFLRIIE